MELSVEVVRVKNTKHKTNNQKRSAPTTNNQQSAHFECLSVLPVYFVKKIELTVEVVRVKNQQPTTNNQQPKTNNQKPKTNNQQPKAKRTSSASVSFQFLL
jgi:hypothetical protein